MTWVTLALLTLGTAIVCFDAYAIRKAYLSELYEPIQFWAQTLFILLVPLLGALLAIYLCRDRIPLFQKPPEDGVRDIDGTCSNIDYHG